MACFQGEVLPGRRGRVTSHRATRPSAATLSLVPGLSVAIATVPRVQLPPEIQLAQRLAGNEQVTRDRAVRKLRKYIVARTQRAAGGFTHDELLKVWKGLFYCMWMQDKPLLQGSAGS
ncbi:ribosomal RNA processing protein 1 homolog A-like [Myotis lucifugus]|uniref:ribosomal RNA processing protein 1 homolog A-like n=1 Tax=Myotis lucifugus TaxID=59463 RepID=UPI000CCC03D4|nr:ribosomal RNA processing protein 1 homolog A-like [Myotis lucifugus]